MRFGLLAVPFIFENRSLKKVSKRASLFGRNDNCIQIFAYHKLLPLKTDMKMRLNANINSPFTA